MIKAWFKFAAMAAILLAPSLANADELNTGRTGRYGQVRLASGFEPDPYTVTVTAGGEVEAAEADGDCEGFIDKRASFTLRYRAGGARLFIGAVSAADAMLAVRAPDGEWYCDDDDGGDLNPLLTWENPPSGRYQIWVGRFGVEGEAAPAVLHISEIGGPAPVEEQAAASARPDPALTTAYGGADLADGFPGDPRTQRIAAGGPINVSALGIAACTGWIARAPDYRVTWTAGASGLPLVFSVVSEADTTLVINDAQGHWICDDDGGNEGLNPAITIAQPASGQYEVWVGTFEQGDLQPSTLHVSQRYAQ